MKIKLIQSRWWHSNSLYFPFSGNVIILCTSQALSLSLLIGNEICFSSWSSGLMLKKTAAGCDLLSWEAGLGGLCKQDGKINHKGNLDSFQCCVELCPLPFSSRRKIAEICTMIWEVACRHCPSYSFPAWLFALPDAASIFCFGYPACSSAPHAAMRANVFLSRKCERKVI